jgi:hypothetical protein
MLKATQPTAYIRYLMHEARPPALRCDGQGDLKACGRQTLRVVGGAAILIALVLAAGLVILFNQPQVTMNVLFDDPPSQQNYAIYVGLYSNIGYLLWAASAAICLALVSLPAGSGGDRAKAAWSAPRRVLLCGALASLLLLFDDMWMVHDRLMQHFIGIKQPISSLLVFGALALVMLAFWRSILATNYLILGVSLVLLGGSLALDLTHDEVTQWMPGLLTGAVWLDESWIFLEDAVKLVGIAVWLGYFWTVGRAYALQARVRPEA